MYSLNSKNLLLAFSLYSHSTLHFSRCLSTYTNYSGVIDRNFVYMSKREHKLFLTEK